MTTEGQIEDALIAALGDLKYTHRSDIRGEVVNPLRTNTNNNLSGPTA